LYLLNRLKHYDTTPKIMAFALPACRADKQADLHPQSLPDKSRRQGVAYAQAI